MPRKNTRNTRGKIVSAAWKLFYEQGYEETTVEDIIFESETSKGTFYHYFEGKDALLGTLSTLFDEKYEALVRTMDSERNALDILLWLNRELFAMIDSSVPAARALATSDSLAVRRSASAAARASAIEWRALSLCARLSVARSTDAWRAAMA